MPQWKFFRLALDGLNKINVFKQCMYLIFIIKYFITSNPRSKRNLFCYWNLVFAILIDVCLGILSCYYLTSSYSVDIPTITVFINDVADNLQTLLHWLMGVPVGLKLNYPLNEALGRFFLYHIYLWKTYTNSIEPVLSMIIGALPYIGCLGLSTQIGLANDLISIATVHIYCFYGYATRIYGLQAKIMLSLWRLFQGKKWNSLRERVDSFHYDNHQLFLGTLFFTILLFLLPTVALYYVVFTMLNLTVLIPSGIFYLMSNVLKTMPWYAAIKHIMRSNTIQEAMVFEINYEPRKKKVSSLNMKTQNVGYKKLMFILESHYQELFITPFICAKREFNLYDNLYNLISGKLIASF